MSPHTIRYRNCLYRYYRCRSTVGGRRPCGCQVSAPAIEGALQQNLELLWGLRLDARQIRDHVESVVYDHRDQKIRAKVVPPPVPEAGTDSAKVTVPLGKRKRRNPLKPA